MNAAPHATHAATGRYYAKMTCPANYALPCVVVAPDGTEAVGFLTKRQAADEDDGLNAEDHTTRAMTDADRITAIATVVADWNRMKATSADAMERIAEVLS